MHGPADHPETGTPQLRRPNILWYCSDQQRLLRTAGRSAQPTRSKNTIADVTLAESLPVQSRNTVAAPSATAS